MSEPHPPANAEGSPDDKGETREAINAAVRWLIGLQNRDGGFPTFCRGWGALPFDRSSPDITAHCLRAMIRTYHHWMRGKGVPSRSVLLGESGAWGGNWITPASLPRDYGFSVPRAIGRGFRFLRKAQRPDGSWLPLWFGNQDAPDDINPTYGTARVLAAFRDAGLTDDPACRRGVAWLLANQNDDHGWGGVRGAPSSDEETALAVEILASLASNEPGTWRGVGWLIERIEAGTIAESSPIGFYFAKLWYFERLYPMIFTVGALGSARRALKDRASSGHDGSDA